MRNNLKPVSLFFAITLMLTGAACTAPVTNSNVSNTNANANTAPAPPNAARTSASAQNQVVTLPLLDAFFTDESFPGELKSKLQLSDEQINNLKKIAREQTAQLREGDDEHEGTTTAARARAMEQIEGAIGKEKAAQLATLVSERWNTSGGAASASATAPTVAGAVPTDTRVVVNAPAFRMDVFESGKLVKTYRVGIGYPEFPLPAGLRKADTIIFNPTWTPPDEPWVEAPGSKVKVGETVKAGDKLNPLGPIKIPIGLPSLIHGGKPPSKIGTFASHGCVGLTNPQVQDFSQLLGRLGGTQITSADVANYAKNKTETENVKLQTPVPVELRYETIAVVDGKLYIYRDVYDRNTNTEENLRAVLAAYNVTPDQLSESERAQVMEALKEMSRDARGNLDSTASNANANTNSNANANLNRNGNSNSRNITRTIKGKKEAVIEIAALKGKGYPAPVNLDAGGSKPETASAPASKKKGR